MGARYLRGYLHSGEPQMEQGKMPPAPCSLEHTDCFQVFFQNRVQAAKTHETKLRVVLYSKERFDRVVAAFFTMIVVSLIMGPVFILYLLRHRSGYVQNAVTLGFTTFFALVCATCTTARRHEIFAATAAYCAVLVVFTSPNGNSG